MTPISASHSPFGLHLRFGDMIAEGFKGSTVPKVLVVGADVVSPLPQNLVAVVSDQQRIEDVPCYGFQDIELLAQRIKSQIIKGGRLIAEKPKSPDAW